MGRIVLTTVGSFGDLHPKIAIAVELRKRGHDIVFATHKEYQAKLEGLGFAFHRMRPDCSALSDPIEMARMMDLRKGQEYVIRHWILPSLRDTFDDLMTCATHADFIIAGEGVMAARLVAETMRIPWACTVLQPLSFLSVYDPFVLPGIPFPGKLRRFGTTANKLLIGLIKAVTKSWAAPVQQLRGELGLPPLKGNLFVDDKYSPHLVLALFSEVLARPQPDWAPGTVVTGFPFYDGSDAGAELAPKLKNFLKSGPPPIVFTLGSSAVMTPGSFFEESILAVRQLKRRAVLLVGKNPSPQNLTDEIMALDYAPYSHVFPHACAIVHQGGIGTTAQALRAGRPTLVMPYSLDQPDNAARVDRLGTSRTIPRKEYAAVRVAKELRELLERPDYAIKADKFGRIIQAEDAVGVACDAIESRLSRDGVEQPDAPIAKRAHPQVGTY